MTSEQNLKLAKVIRRAGEIKSKVAGLLAVYEESDNPADMFQEIESEVTSACDVIIDTAAELGR